MLKRKQTVSHPAALPPRCVRVGDIVARRPETFSESVNGIAGPMKGTGIFVHPKGRFHVVEFPGKLAAIRESFCGVLW